MTLHLPRWLDDELHERGWVLFALGAGALLLVGWFAWAQFSRPAEPAPSREPAAVALLAPVVPAVAVPAPPVALPPAPAPRAALPTCPHQQLDITDAGGLQRGCVSATRTRQSGSVRSYLADAEGVSNWGLVVDVAGEKVLSVRLKRAALGTAPETLFVCDNHACAGASLGAPDAHGARALTLADARLQALPPGQRWRRVLPGAKQPRPAAQTGSGEDSPAAPTVARVSATLKIQSDRNDPVLACPGATLTIVQGPGSVADFCPLGSAGFEIADDGQTRFVFRDLEGRQLVIAMRSDHSVDSVVLGTLACRYPQCGGVGVQARGDPADPEVERRFAFSGTTLSPARHGGPTATLNGSLVMPSQQ